MIFSFIVFVVVALAVSGSTVQANENEQQQQQQTVQLTREMVDALLQVLSPTCRVEMEGALGSQMEISDECKYEIQRTLASFQNNGQQENDFQGKEAEPPRKAPASPKAASPPAGGMSPLVYIFGFVAVAIAGVAGLVVYVNGQRGAAPAAPKPKKLSKKKVRYMAALLFIATMYAFLSRVAHSHDRWYSLFAVCTGGEGAGAHSDRSAAPLRIEEVDLKVVR
jgi:dipeptide/tripeptide permease